MKSHDLKFLVFLTLVTLTAFTAAATAHPASDLVLAYNTSTQELQVTFTHMVANPATHYIGEVEVMSMESGRILQRQYTSQPTNNTFTYTYPLALSNGTRITVQGECNLGGEISRSLDIGQVPTTTITTVTTTTTPPTTTMVPPTTTQAPGFVGLLTAFALITVAAALYRHR
jgi:hypothetical protein